MTQPFMSADNGRRNIRIVLLIIILATIPFYCIGVILYLFAPQGGSVILPTPTAITVTPGTDLTATIASPAPDATTPPVIASPLTPQVTVIPPPTLRPLSPTPLFPTATPFIPTQPPPPPPPTNTPIPQATATTIPIFPTDTTIPFTTGS